MSDIPTYPRLAVAPLIHGGTRAAAELYGLHHESLDHAAIAAAGGLSSALVVPGPDGVWYATNFKYMPVGRFDDVCIIVRPAENVRKSLANMPRDSLAAMYPVFWSALGLAKNSRPLDVRDFVRLWNDRMHSLFGYTGAYKLIRIEETAAWNPLKGNIR